MTEKLKPCPFCGNERVCLDSWTSSLKGELWYVICKKCGVVLMGSKGYSPNGFDNGYDAIEHWNSRAEVKGDA